jgi:hypothetical protein
MPLVPSVARADATVPGEKRPGPGKPDEVIPPPPLGGAPPAPRPVDPPKPPNGEPPRLKGKMVAPLPPEPPASSVVEPSA